MQTQAMFSNTKLSRGRFRKLTGFLRSDKGQRFSEVLDSLNLRQKNLMLDYRQDSEASWEDICEFFGLPRPPEGLAEAALLQDDLLWALAKEYGARDRPSMSAVDTYIGCLLRERVVELLRSGNMECVKCALYFCAKTKLGVMPLPNDEETESAAATLLSSEETRVRI